MKRYKFPTAAVVLQAIIVVIVSLIGLTGVEGARHGSLAWQSFNAMRTFLTPIMIVILCGALAGVLGWAALYWLRRDGLHRWEEVTTNGDKG